MSEIDYTRYYLKNYNTTSAIKNRKPIMANNKKNYKRKLFTVFLIIVFLCCCLFATNFLLEGKVFLAINCFFTNRKTANYYILAKSFDTRQTAFAQSLLVRQGGASGYFYADGDKFNVVYSIFLDKEDARRVQEKNDNTFIIEKTFISEDESFFDQLNSSLKEIIEASEKLEEGTIYENDLLQITSTIELQLMEEKNNILTENNNKYTTETNILDLYIGGLNSLSIPSTTRVTLLSDLRYIISSVVVALPGE